MNKRRILWIDIVRFTAVFFLVLEHLYPAVYKTQVLHNHISYSVELFVLAGGFTAGLSLYKKKQALIHVIKRVISLLLAYAFASFVYYLYFHHASLSPVTFIKKLASFSDPGMFYFIFFYIQLLGIAGILLKLLQARSLPVQIFFLVGLFAVSNLLSRVVLFPQLYGAGKYLFGGTYLFLFSLGIFFSLLNRKTDHKFFILKATFGVAILVCFEFFRLFEKTLTSPPSIYQMLYSVALFLLISLSARMLEKMKYLFLVRIAAGIGKRSFPIYLYHYLVLLVTASYITHHNIVQPYAGILLFACAIVIPLLFRKVADLFMNAFSYSFWIIMKK